MGNKYRIEYNWCEDVLGFHFDKEYSTNSKFKFFIKLLRISRKYKIIDITIRK